MKGGRDGMIVGFYNDNVPVQSMLIATEIVSSNPAHGEVYSI